MAMATRTGIVVVTTDGTTIVACIGAGRIRGTAIIGKIAD